MCSQSLCLLSMRQKKKKESMNKFMGLSCFWLHSRIEVSRHRLPGHAALGSAPASVKTNGPKEACGLTNSPSDPDLHVLTERPLQESQADTKGGLV